MGIKKVIVYKDLPLEVDKTYVTKFATGERFTIKNIKYNSKGIPVMLFGIYEKSPNSGLCSLKPERLIPEKTNDGFIHVCDHCGNIIENIGFGDDGKEYSYKLMIMDK